MSPVTKSSGTSSVSKIDTIKLWSSLQALSLDWYCSIGISSGPEALPLLSFFTQVVTSSMVGGGTGSSFPSSKLTSSSSGPWLNFFSRNSAHSSSCWSVSVMTFPRSSLDGCMLPEDFFPDSCFASLKVSLDFPTAFASSICCLQAKKRFLCTENTWSCRKTWKSYSRRIGKDSTFRKPCPAPGETEESDVICSGISPKAEGKTSQELEHQWNNSQVTRRTQNVMSTSNWRREEGS